MRPLLVVMNPRNIRVAMESYKALPTDVVYLRGWTELEIETEAWPVMMRDATDYTHVVVISDDARVPLGAWDAVMSIASRGHPVVTGYCNLDLNRGFDVSNQVRSVLPQEPLQIDMEFYPLPDLLANDDDEIPTSFHGYSLTCMTMDICLKFPFRCYRVEGDPFATGHSSDFHHARRLADAGVDIVCARDGFVIHLKERWNQGDEATWMQPVHLSRKAKEIVWERQ